MVKTFFRLDKEGSKSLQWVEKRIKHEQAENVTAENSKILAIMENKLARLRTSKVVGLMLAYIYVCF